MKHLPAFALAMKQKALAEVKADLAHNLKTIRIGMGSAQERLNLEAKVDRPGDSKVERAVTNPSLHMLPG